MTDFSRRRETQPIDKEINKLLQELEEMDEAYSQSQELPDEVYDDWYDLTQAAIVGKDQDMPEAKQKLEEFIAFLKRDYPLKK